MILLVVSDATVLSIISKKLDLEGLEYRAIDDGSDAFEAALVSSPWLIIMDTELPSLSGRMLLHQLKRHPSTSILPILILSNDDREEEITFFLENGAQDYVTIPFSLRELWARIQLILTRSPRHNRKGKFFEAI
jgi:DNA-binding response OmpR family regulator